MDQETQTDLVDTAEMDQETQTDLVDTAETQTAEIIIQALVVMHLEKVDSQNKNPTGEDNFHFLFFYYYEYI